MRPTWQAAEERLDQPEELAKACEGLPARVGLVLRAMGALQAGHLGGIRQCAQDAQEAGFLDIAAILTLLLADPSTLDPTTIRRLAKAQGLGKWASLPFLDLLRLTASARASKKCTASPALRKVARHRPLVAALVRNLTSRKSTVWTFPELTDWSPRAEEIQALVRVVLTSRSQTLSMHQSLYSDPLVQLTAGDWPDLFQPRAETAFYRRLAGGEPWHDDHDDVTSWMGQEPRHKRREFLATMLARLQSELSNGRHQSLVHLCHAAAHLAHDDGRVGDLCLQLRCLEQKLRWLENPSQPSPRLLEALWLSHGGRLADPERLVLAHQIWELDPLHFAPDTVQQVYVALLRLEPDVAVVDEVLESWLGLFSGRSLVRKLTSVSLTKARRMLLHGLTADQRGDTRRVLQAASEVLNSGESDAAEVLYLKALKHSSSLSQRDGGACEALLEAWVLTGRDLAGWCRLLGPAPVGLTVPPAVCQAVMSLARAAPASASSQALALHAVYLVGNAPALQEFVRAEGRRLRRMRPVEAAEIRAAEIICRLYAQDGLFLAGDVRAQLSPLTRFVTRRGLQAARTAAQGIEVFPLAGIARAAWITAHEEQFGDDPWWHEGEDEYGELLILAGFEPGPVELDEAMERLQDRIDRDGPPDGTHDRGGA
jgi:hypothetical protein